MNYKLFLSILVVNKEGKKKHVECSVDFAGRFAKIISVSAVACSLFFIHARSFGDFYFYEILTFCSHIDANKARYIDVLREAVAIKSVSAWADHRPEVSKMAKWMAEKLRNLGAEVELAELGDQTLQNGLVIPLPEVVLGTLGTVSVQLV